MQNNQQQYYPLNNCQLCTPNNCSTSQNWNNQQRFNSTQLCNDNNTNQITNDWDNQRCQSLIQHPQNRTLYSQQYTYGYQPSKMITSHCGQQRQALCHPIDCCQGRNCNTVNQQNQYERKGEMNLYNYSPSSLTNRALNIHMNGLHSKLPNNHFQQQSNLFSTKMTNDVADMLSNSYKTYQRKTC